MNEILSLPFMQRALIAGALVGFLASYYGVFVVQRGLSFLGSGLAHAAFGGVALGLLLNQEPLWIAVPFTILVAIGIFWVKTRTQLGNDTAVGIFFSVSMALGIVFLFLKREYTSDAFTYLFGSILAVTTRDIRMTVAVAIITFLTFPFWRRWAYASFDRELAETDHLSVVKDDYILAVLIAVTVVSAIKVVGIVLIAAFLVIPAATARLLSRTFRSMTILSIILGIFGAVSGLIFSY
ncbi:metal ABC transporter permease, partial [candidate division KSB1 bacterium]|nr:metal ABC transporter permease [candidate division KSB1 bacterium]